MKHPRGIEIQRPVAGLYPATGDFRCISVVVPDDDSYAILLAGFYAILTRAYNWQGDYADRGAVASRMLDAFTLTDWLTCMDCVGVAECIGDSTDVRSALEQWFIDALPGSSGMQTVINNVYSPYAPGEMPPSVTGTDLLPATIACDQDKAWGAVSQLVESMHQNNLDSFEVAEGVTNLVERAQLLFSAIPVLETLPVDEAVEYVETLWTDDLFEAYVANDTTAYRDEIKCALFCLATTGDCKLSIDDVFNYFINRLSGSTSDTFAELVAFLIAGTWTGTEINDAFFAGQILIMKYGNQFFDAIGIRPFQMYLSIGERTPSDAWELICDTCPDPVEWAIVPLEGYNTGTLSFNAGTGEYTLVAESNTDGYYRAVARGISTGDWIFTSSDIPTVEFPGYYAANSTDVTAGNVVSGNHYNGISYSGSSPYTIHFTLT